MSAERLRKAARVLRAVHQRATPGRWYAGEAMDSPFVATDPSGDHGQVFDAIRPGDAAYAATMGPPVGWAMAAWLDDEADLIDHGDDITRPPLAVADAILAGDS